MHIQGPYITDDEGRTLILRGCNLEGSVRHCPAGERGLKAPEGVFPGAYPFSPEEADSLFGGLRSRGFTFIRVGITWDALEHEGPGIYDEAYLAYLRKITLIAGKRGIAVFIVPGAENRDRRAGGIGAPAWVPEKIGLDSRLLDPSDPYLRATLSTLFFAGNCFAPEFYLEGARAQDWLQERYLGAMRHCFRRLKNCAAIAGWSAMESPGRGFIGGRGVKRGDAAGPLPEPFRVMAAASGYQTESPVNAAGPGGRDTAGCGSLKPWGGSLFKPGFSCPWKQAGVWTDEGGSPRLLRADHFDRSGGKVVCFADDFLKPFLLRFMERLREVRENTIFLIEGVPGEDPPAWSAGDGTGAVRAFRFPEGPGGGTGGAAGKNAGGGFSAALAEMVLQTRKYMGNIPCLAGEWGLDGEDCSGHYDGLDAHLLHGAIESGGPDLSPAGMGRPYPLATAGTPLGIRWDREGGVLSYRFRAEAGISAPTEIYIPPAPPGGEWDISLREPDTGPDTGPDAGEIRVRYDREQGRGIITNAAYRGDMEIVITCSERKNSSMRL
jgi:hypothetical protein